MYKQNASYNYDLFVNCHNIWYDTKYTSTSVVDIQQIYQIVKMKFICVICQSNTVYTKLNTCTKYMPIYSIQRKKYCIPCAISSYSK